MGVLQRFEHRVERLVNGAFARAFKAEVQPVEIAAALQRECDDRAAIVARGPAHGAQRVHRRAGRARPRAAGRLRGAAHRRAGRDGARARRRAGLPVRRPGDGRARAGRRPRHRPVPRPQRGRRRGRRPRDAQPARPGPARPDHRPRWDCPPARVEIGTHRLPADPPGHRARPRPRRRPAHRRPRRLPPPRRDPAVRRPTPRSSTSARPTAWSSTATGSSRRRCPTARRTPGQHGPGLPPRRGRRA